MILQKLYFFGLLYLCLISAIFCGSLTFWNVAVSYFDARYRCLSNGSELVKIDNQATFDRVKQLAYPYKSDFWIGLTLDTSKLPLYQYVHEDGETATFLPWETAYSEPDKQDTDLCIRVHYENKNEMLYRTRHCSRSHFFICERKDIPVTTTERLDTSTTTMSWNTSASEEIRTTKTSRQFVSTNVNTFLTTDVTDEQLTIFGDFTTTNILSSSFSNGTCTCLCYYSQNATNETRLEEIRAALYVNKKILSRHVRTLECAADDRTSSTVVGLTGASFIALVIFFIVIGDFVSVLKFMSLLICRHS